MQPRACTKTDGRPVSAMDKCARCNGHPKHAHALQPASPMCSNCRVVKDTKLIAQHYFLGAEEAQIK